MADQSRIESAIESATDLGTGFVIAWLSWLFIVPVFYPELKTSATVGGGVTIIFTVISLIRKYFWRRFFANGFHRVVHNLIKTVWSY